MRKFRVFIFVLSSLVFFTTQSAIAAPEKGVLTEKRTIQRTLDGNLAQVETIVTELTAVIEKLDIEKRMVTLKGPRNELTIVKVSPAVKRLSEFKVGDKVVTEHYEALAFEIRQPTAAELASPRTVAGAIGKTTAALPPGVGAAMASHTVVTIESIDLVTNMITMKLPEGELLTIKARYPENLKRVKVGDTVAITYAEAIAIRLDPFRG